MFVHIIANHDENHPWVTDDGLYEARNNGQYAPSIYVKKNLSPFISSGGVSMFSPNTLPKGSNDIVQISIGLQTGRWKVLSVSKR